MIPSKDTVQHVVQKVLLRNICKSEIDRIYRNPTIRKAANNLAYPIDILSLWFAENEEILIRELVKEGVR